jgi:hypothetical protein
LPEVSGVKQDSLSLITEAPCKTFAAMYGAQTPEKIKKVLFFTTGYVHDRTALKLTSELG